MRYDLKAPCKNCPFAETPTRIRFSCEERARESEESAYRNGFPCHLSAEGEEEPDGTEGFVAGRNTQHCAGAAAMFLNAGYDTWPGIDNSERIAERLEARITQEARLQCFEDEEAFFAANRSRDEIAQET